MELFLLGLVVIIAGLVYALYQQTKLSQSTQASLQQALSNVDANDRVIADLREQLTAMQRDSLESKALFATIANAAYDLVFVLDDECTVIALNKSAEAFFGDRKPIGELFSDLIESTELDEIITRAVQESEGLEEQFKLGTQHYRVRTQIMNYGEQRTFIGVALQDVTQLVRLNRARRDMVANISHELSTPIANIRLIIDGLFLDGTRPKRKASIQSLRAIASEADSLQWTVQELHDLSMIESGQSLIKLIEQPLAEIVEEAIERLREKLDRKNLTVIHHVPSKLRVLCDRDHIRRVIINLFSNAIKWSPSDTNITLSTVRSDEDVTISIYDNGPGVPDDQVQRIFERFYQVDISRTGHGGSGLGLAICKHIVEAHGGKIWAEGNSQGEGGRFMFTLLDATTGEAAEEMDRAQHDYVFPNNTHYQSVPRVNTDADDYEIELFDEDEVTTE